MRRVRYCLWRLTYWLYCFFGVERIPFQVGVSSAIPKHIASGYFFYEEYGKVKRLPYLLDNEVALYTASRCMVNALFHQLEQLGFQPTSITIKSLNGFNQHIKRTQHNP